MSYDLNAEMNNVKNTEVQQSQYINEPCVELVTIKKTELKTTANGKPFMEVVFEDGQGRISTNSFFLAVNGDSEDAAQFKRERIKRLLENAEVNMNLAGTEIWKDAIGKKLNVLFKSREYIGYNKDLNDKPEIKKAIEYSFSEKAGNTITGNQSYFWKTLSPEDHQKYQGLLAQWERDNAHLASSLEQGQAPAPAPAQAPAQPQNTSAPAKPDFPTEEVDDDPF